MNTRKRRKKRIRRKISGTAARPRLSLHQSLTSLYAQIIDDDQGKTLCGALVRGKKNQEAAEQLATKICETAQKAAISTVVFDRNGKKYHGVVKRFADKSREGGLTF